jgi:CRP-like cAMP-binding protein
MFTDYLNILSAYSPLSESTKSQLEPYISVKNLNKDELLLKHGDVCKHIYYVNKGFIRIFYFKDGKEVTEWLTNDKHFFFSITSYFENTPSHLIIEAIEDSEIIQLSKAGLEKLRKVNLEIANLMIEWISSSLVLSQSRMDSIQFETAKQRYDSLLKMQPEILHRAPLQHIASFLGITQETLSRIRSKK